LFLCDCASFQPTLFDEKLESNAIWHFSSVDEDEPKGKRASNEAPRTTTHIQKGEQQWERKGKGEGKAAMKMEQGRQRRTAKRKTDKSEEEEERDNRRTNKNKHQKGKRAARTQQGTAE
jgi:hypothetical protein